MTIDSLFARPIFFFELIASIIGFKLEQPLVAAITMSTSGSLTISSINIFECEKCFKKCLFGELGLNEIDFGENSSI